MQWQYEKRSEIELPISFDGCMNGKAAEWVRV